MQFVQASGSNKTELHKLLKGQVERVMERIGFPRECLVCDATPAALRNILEQGNNNIITISDEYGCTCSSLKIGQQVNSIFL